MPTRRTFRHPLHEECIRDREHDRPDEEPDDPERDEAADHPGEDQEQGKVRTSPDQDRSQEVPRQVLKDGTNHGGKVMSDFIRCFEQATASLKLASLVVYALVWAMLVIGRWP